MEAVGDFFTDIKDAVGDLLSDDEIKNVLNQVKSGFEEHITVDNLKRVANKIKSGLEDVADQEQIKQILGAAKGQVKDTTGKFGKVIQCFENDIKDTSCLEQFTESTAISIQVR